MAINRGHDRAGGHPNKQATRGEKPQLKWSSVGEQTGKEKNKEDF